MTNTFSNKPSIKPSMATRIFRWLLALFIVLVALGIGLVYSLFFRTQNLLSIYANAVNNAAPPQIDPFIVGDLGGMKVKIPRHFARLVDYEGDPTWGEKRQGDTPQRTYESKLTGFTSNIRYPDMQGLSSDELRLDEEKSTIYNTMWFRVDVSTGSHFGDGFYYERSKKEILDGFRTRTGLVWAKSPKKEYGLEVYSPINADISTRVPFQGDFDDKDHFFAYNKEGKVKTYIECSNKTHAAAPCEHNFDLPLPLKARVILGYRRGLLPHWQDLEAKTTAHLLSFKVDVVSQQHSALTHALTHTPSTHNLPIK
jgi:hypothetical protein